MAGVDAPRSERPSLSPPSSTTPLNAPTAFAFRQAAHRRTPTRHSHGSKSTSTADDSNASSSSATNTGGSSLPLLPHHRWWPRHSATPNLLLRWYVRDGASCIRARARSMAAGDQAALLEAQAEAQYRVFVVSVSRVVRCLTGCTF
jgi:hypothetical protein